VDLAGHYSIAHPKHIWQLPYDFCLAGLIFSLPLITIGAANAFGWMLAYLRGASVDRGMDHRDCGHRPAFDHAVDGAAVHDHRDFIEPVPTIIIFMRW